MKKYLIFAGHNFYPNGGVSDFKTDASSVEEARDYLANSDERFNWYQIVDKDTMKIVESNR